MSSMSPAELKKHIEQMYGSVLQRVSQLEYNSKVQQDTWLEEITNSIIATVRFGDPAHLRNDIKAILELVIEHEKESQ